MSGGTSQPNSTPSSKLWPNASRHAARYRTLNECSDYWERCDVLSAVTPRQIRVAVLSTRGFPRAVHDLREQAAAWVRSSLREVEETYAQVNQLFGDIVKVTPSSKVVGDMALFLMAKEMTPEICLKLASTTTSRCLILWWKCFSGVLCASGGWPRSCKNYPSRETPLRGLPSDNLLRRSRS